MCSWSYVCATHTLNHQWHCLKPCQTFARCCFSSYDAINLMSVANVSVHGSMLNEDILAFNMTSRVHKQFSLFGWFFVNNTAKWWYCVTPEYCYFLCFSQDSVATHCRCGGKYDTGPVANLRTSPTGQKIWKSVNIYQSYERISSGKFFMAHSAFVFVFYLLNI